MRARIAAVMLGLALAVLGARAALAQQVFPAQSIELVVPAGPGGGGDQLARKLAPLLEAVLPVPVFVTNIPGAAGNAGLTKLLSNPPDGYTMATLVGVTVAAWAAGVGYARAEDFTVLAVAQNSPSMLFVPADSPLKTIHELLAYAKANPGRLRVATAGYGSTDDITLKYLAVLGYGLVNVPYARPEERYLSPFHRRSQALYEEPGDVAHLLEEKRLRPLVVFDSERHPAFPGVPSSKELGLGIHDLPNFRTLVVRSGTPAERVQVLRAAIDRALDTPEWKTYCVSTFSCTRKYSPAEAQRHVREFHASIQKYLRESGADSK